MKKILIYSIVLLFSLAACSKDFLNTDKLTQKNSSNFPANATEANQALTGAYSVLNSFNGMSYITLLSELMSDDRFGGGGQNDRDPQAIDVFKVTSMNMHQDCWTKYYRGIYRCNSLLGSLNNAKWDTISQRKQVFGETSFLRAYYYFDLARLFGNVPLVTSPLPVNNPQAKPEELYGQIVLDLKNAIDSLPAKPFAPEYIGRATKWSAEALMARVFLFYTGYYNKTEIALPGTAGIITKQQVIGWVDDCVTNSGHSLVADFRNQWPYTISGVDYPYVKNNNLSWVGDAGANKENIFNIRFMYNASTEWNSQVYYSNQLDIYCGQRSGTVQVPIGKGWGFCPVNPRFYEEWPSTDIRRQGSICNVLDPTEGIETYGFGSDMQWQESGYIGKKYVAINVKFGGVKVNWSVMKYNAVDNFQINNTQDIVTMRLADVLLMGAELGSGHAQQYMDMVRLRSGLTSLAPTLDNIKIERHHELAFEGVRYFDLLRWYGKEAGVEIKKNDTGATIFNMAVATTINAEANGYFNKIDARVRATGGFLMIPDNEIQLSKGVLVQNPGWVNSGDYTF